VSSPAALQAALAFMRKGNHARAEQLCRQVLQQASDDFGARHLLGIVLLLRNAPTEAEQHLAHAVQLAPAMPVAHYNHGNALMALGRAADAIGSYDRAIALKPDFAEALYNRGNAQAALGQADAAIASYRAALAQRPDLVDAWNNLGQALIAQGRHAEALQALDRALARQPAHAGALNNRGAALLALGRPEDALESCDRAVAAAPASPEAHDSRGLALQELGRLDDAVASHGRAIALVPAFARAWCHRAGALRRAGQLEIALRDASQAVALRPDLAETFDTRGTILNELQRYDEALADYAHALSLDPDLAEAHNNLGNVLHDLGRYDDALASLQRAIALRPAYAEAFDNQGMVLQDARRLDEARVAYDTAIALKPGYPEAHKRRATLRLLQGDFAGGLADYDVAGRAHHATEGLPGVRWWTGQPLAGQTIALHEANGIGDTLQFLRYVPRLLALGADVAFVGPPRLFRLLRSAMPQLRCVAPRSDTAFDWQCDLWSLPHRFGTTLDTIPADIPYLAADPEAVARWRTWLGAGHVNVGIAWQGKPDRKIDAGRSIPLAEFAPLARIPGVRLVSLQRGPGIEQLSHLPGGMSVLHPGDDFDAGPDAFHDTAALMQSLDLVVSSDTVIVHLAGALGRPTWLALKHVPEWRWLLDREDSPWYPTLRLFRQRTAGEWADVFDAIAGALRRLVAKKRET
jgi:tetratricopeptide (TPR) repeat protein